MFFTEGWKPLKTLVDTLYDEIWQQVDFEAVGRDVDAFERRAIADLADAVWYFCDKTPKVGITTPAGATVLVSHDLMRSVSVADLENEHVNLRYCTIGSGHWSATYDGREPRTELESRLIYGPFLYAPVVYCSKAVDEFLRSYRSDDSGAAKGERSRAAIARAIGEAWDSGERFVREEARKRFGSGVSVRGFTSAWADATETRPEMKKPGRRRRQVRS
jgi:hypothetical protein